MSRKSRKRNPTLKKLRRDLAYIAIRLWIAVFRLLPRTVGLAFASAVGKIIPLFARTSYTTAVENLTAALGGERSHDEIRRIARDMFRHAAMNFADVARLGIMTADEIQAITVPHNIDILRRHLQNGRGIIALTTHTGCWEHLGVYLATIGIPLSVVARKLYDPRLEKLLLETRTQGGMINISRGGNTRDIIRALRNNTLLGVLVDQDFPAKGVFVNFFGRPAHTASSPATLALKYDAPIIPVFTYRDKENRHHACIGDRIGVKLSGDGDADITAIIAACSKVTEDFIRRHPEQWVWFHRRWKTQPPVK